MCKISSKHSIRLSLVICVLFFFVCLGTGVLLPRLLPLGLAQAVPAWLSAWQWWGLALFVLLYLALGIMTGADILMFLLLKRVQGGQVFTDRSVALIRAVSWCCFFLSGVLCVLGLWFRLGFFAAFAAVFLGTCLRVVKNVIEEATRIKLEHDLTV